MYHRDCSAASHPSPHTTGNREHLLVLIPLTAVQLPGYSQALRYHPPLSAMPLFSLQRQSDLSLHRSLWFLQWAAVGWIIQTRVLRAGRHGEGQWGLPRHWLMDLPVGGAVRKPTLERPDFPRMCRIHCHTCEFVFWRTDNDKTQVFKVFLHFA